MIRFSCLLMLLSPTAAAAKYVVLRFKELNFCYSFIDFKKNKNGDICSTCESDRSAASDIDITAVYYIRSKLKEHYVTTTHADIGRKPPLDLFIPSKQ